MLEAQSISHGDRLLDVRPRPLRNLEFVECDRETPIPILRAAVTREWLVRFENGKATVPISRVLDVLAALELVVDVSESDV